MMAARQLLRDNIDNVYYHNNDSGNNVDHLYCWNSVPLLSRYIVFKSPLW